MSTLYAFRPLSAVFLVASLGLGCGSSTTCTPDTCAGCCQPNGSCALPTAEHCGLSGASCSTCVGAQQCVDGACALPGGPTGGPGSGSSGTSSTSTSSSGSSGATGSSSGSTHGSTSGSSGSTHGSTSGSTGSTGIATTGSSGTTGDCCAALNCPSGCDLGTCACLAGTGGTSGSVDAGDICQTQSCAIFAETQHTLYQVDPNPPNAITELCDFGGDIPGDAGVNDIAIQRNGGMYGITKTDLYRIDPATCLGTHVAALAQSAGGYNCLTFTDQDTLLAADASGAVATVDVSSGAVSSAGSFGTNLGCSGDVVALSDGRIYATARVLNDGGPTDLLVTLDPTNGYKATPVSQNQTGYHSIFGLGFWGGTLYGFDRSGNVLAIDPVQGTATLIHNEPNTSFYGAGTTPLAPVIITNG